jgi:hypothetical protein
MQYSVIEQIQIAARPQNRLACIVGAILGGFVPVFAFTLAHLEAATNPYMWIPIVAGMIYSAVTVFEWARIAFGGRALKAVAFCALVEAVAIFASTLAIGVAALAILVTINAFATGFQLVEERNQKRRHRARTIATGTPRSKAKPRTRTRKRTGNVHALPKAA